MDGVLVIDKPEGLTSHDVVARARRLLGERRIGHTGTLDPMATGVLPLALGRATRLARFLSASDKTYEATVLFGVTTDTLDVTGEETSRTRAQVSADVLREAIRSLSGHYDQMPPAYSAKKVAGRRAYDFARNQEPVELRAVPVRVSAVEVHAFDGERCRLTLTCSAGFYVRSFARDLGERCGPGACLEELRRTRSGEFRIEEAVSLEALDAPEAADTLVIPMGSLLKDFPAVTLSAEGLTRVTHGRSIRPSDVTSSSLPALPAPTWVRLLDPDGDLVAMAVPEPPPGWLHPEVVLV